MQVFEKINALKGTSATIEQMVSWSYNNKICPLQFEDGLELDCKYPKELDIIAHECCSG